MTQAEIRKQAAINSVNQGLGLIMSRYGYDTTYYFKTLDQAARSVKKWRSKGYDIRNATLDDVNVKEW